MANEEFEVPLIDPTTGKIDPSVYNAGGGGGGGGDLPDNIVYYDPTTFLIDGGYIPDYFVRLVFGKIDSSLISVGSLGLRHNTDWGFSGNITAPIVGITPWSTNPSGVILLRSMVVTLGTLPSSGTITFAIRANGSVIAQVAVTYPNQQAVTTTFSNLGYEMPALTILTCDVLSTTAVGAGNAVVSLWWEHKG